MPSWNHLNVFSRPRVTGPSASFDPARTGDPVAPGAERPAIGFGDTRPGSDGHDYGYESRRRPIGFAPPADEPRYRTEISFKRHHSVPIASAGSQDEAGSEPSPWLTPGSVSEGVVENMAADETPSDGEKVPFYKREISFRRKRVEEEHEPAVDLGGDEPSADDVDPEPAPGQVAPVAAEADADGGAAEVVAEETSADEPAADVSAVAPEPDEQVEEPASAESHEEPDAGWLPPAEEESFAVESYEHDPYALEQDESAEAPVEDEVPVEEPQVAAVAVDDAHLVEEPPSGAGRTKGTPAKRKGGRGGKGRRVVGLKIGASQIAAAVIAEVDGRHELVQLARRPIDAGLVVDGEIRDADALASVVKDFFDEHKLPKKDVRIGLASNRIGVRTFEIVGIDDDVRFDNAVRFKAHEVLPVAVHESVLDYRVLEERPNEAGEPSKRILLVVAPRDQVEPYTEVARKAGIGLAGLDLEALSLLRTFVDPKPFAVRAIDDTATVVVSIGHESTTLLVSGGGSCEFTRVFDWGGGTLQDAVAKELGVHPAEAATILRHLSLSGPGRAYDALDEVARTKAVEAVRLRLTPFARELVSSLQFYQTQPDSLGIGELVITGGTSHLEGLGEVLHQMIGVSVRVGDPLARVSLGCELEPAIEATLGSMSVAIGLAIEDEQLRSVNLLPKDDQSATRKRPSLIAVALPAAALVPIVALGFMFVSAHGQVSDGQAQLDAVRAQIDALPQPKQPVIDSALEGAQVQRAQAVASVLGGRVPWDAVLRDVSRVLPENVWLGSLQAQVSPTGAATPVAATTPGITTVPTGAQIDGYTYTQTDVARLLSRLETLPTLTNVTLTSSKVESKGARSIVHFQIAADLNPGGS